MKKNYDYDNMIKERLNLKIKSNVVYNYNSNDVYIINQNGELFKKSDPSKKSWRHYINGGKVCVLNPQYFASYNFDFGNIYHEKSLIYFSFEGNAGINFKSFITKIKLGDDNKFLWTDGLEVNNIKDKLKDIEKIQIVDTTIDNILVKEVLTLFPKLKYVEFISCIIKDECNFNYSFTGEIIFKESLIENFRSFRNSMNNFKFNYSQVLNYSCCSVMSKELEFFHSNIDFYQLFLKTNFMNLENLIIKTPTKYDQYGGNYQADFKNSFFYLPYSAPNIVRLRIEGSVDNLDFITRLSFLNKVSVVSSSGDMAMEYLEINDKNKENDLIRRNKNAVEIKKILFCDEDDNQEKYYATESEMERVLTLNSIYKILSFTPKEKTALEDKYLYGSNYINFLLNESFIKLDGYYNNYYDRLLFHQIDKRDEVFDRLKLCYQHHALFYEDKDRKIVEAKKNLFYIDGRPIMLNRSYKPIKTVEEAKEFITHNDYKKFDDDITKEYLEDVKNVVFTLEKSGQLADIDMQDLLIFISEEGRNISLSLIYKDLLNRLNSGHEIFYKLYINNQQWKYNRHITDTICKCQKALYKMIDSRFSSFSKEELLLIGKDLYDESIFIPYLNLNGINIEEETIRDSINMKCNNNYTKLLESIDRLHEITHKIFDKKYVVTKEELEKIKTLTLRKK